jgi:hypothetical protein
MKQCNICGEQFDNGRVYSNHVRWKHKTNGKECKFCKEIQKCHLEAHEKVCSLNPKNIRVCKCCSNRLTKQQGSFCSSSCSAKSNNLKRQLNQKLSNCIQCDVEIISTTCTKKYCSTCYKNRAIASNRSRVFELHCKICNSKFTHFNKNVKTCCTKCTTKLKSQISKQNPNCGGETNYKRYSYKNIIFDSSWEVEIAIFLDEHQIKWSRSRKHILYWVDSNGECRRYYPDFFLEEFNAYVDPKNPFKQKKDKEKLDFIRKSHILIVGNVNECKQQILNIKHETSKIRQQLGR